MVPMVVRDFVVYLLLIARSRTGVDINNNDILLLLFMIDRGLKGWMSFYNANFVGPLNPILFLPMKLGVIQDVTGGVCHLVKKCVSIYIFGQQLCKCYS